MTNSLLIYRLEDLSVNYFIRDIFESYGFVNIVDDFPKEILELPTVSVVAGKLIEEPLEMGTEAKDLRTRRWFIDVFAMNKSQRDDLAYKILDKLRTSGINVYDYNEGFPPSASPTRINHLSVIKQSYEPIDVIPRLNEKLYFRGQLIMVTQNDQI